MRTNDEIIEIIQNAISEKNMSMSELARKVGLAKSTLSRYINKTREFPLNHADSFAKALNMTPEYLLGVEKPSEPTIVKGFNIEELASEAMFFDGKPVAEDEKIVIQGIIKAYLENKKD
ncbi:repressor [Streptococcus agalactiae LMG 14747]|uniref:Repressor n=1 Tax=Streptococcus agalactiae LMG 14747 TaxID=1154860 RepID=V6Z677_STRAG|nr:repressor [Streptococcus agalactiae LMG 14747]